MFQVGFDPPPQGHFSFGKRQKGGQDFFADFLSKRKVDQDDRILLLISTKIHNDTFKVRVIVQAGIMICCAIVLMNCSTVNNCIKYVAWILLVITRTLISTNRWNITSP